MNCYLKPTKLLDDDDGEFRFKEASAYEGHLHHNYVLTWFCNVTATCIMISQVCIKM